MENILEFIRAALPWIAMGLLLAIFVARSAAKKRKNESKSDDYGAEGMCLGMCLGTAIGTSFDNNTGIGLWFIFSVCSRTNSFDRTGVWGGVYVYEFCDK